METSLSFVCFQGLSPKTATYGNFFGCSMYGNVFLVCCFTKHRPPTVVLSFSLSKNVAYIFFESTIASFYQSLCCGSPRGTMKIRLTEFSHSFAYKFLSIVTICKVFGNPNMKIHFAALVQPPRMFWTLMGWAKNVCCNVVDVKYLKVSVSSNRHIPYPCIILLPINWTTATAYHTAFLLYSH